MPKKPNYNFERQERDKAKAAKKDAKAEAKAAKKDRDAPADKADDAN
ncbi:hypothetical protein [Antarcticirhabdus aurantiaca]|uniref:Uncharacterized protein n=1 Tax=Antarcticirhabdus aurantiaca TaxID=2606717 RepID=A0ACD4NNI4_9HYPH|nr:hypothetical protein [Antarcticirhabdus aurantiaca]WAJ28282.1 hypothetical protein OXU80_26275 [Jeongeuplla avenae]